MAIQSNTTQLEAVNDVLLAIGERQVQSVSNYPAQKAKQALEQALQVIANSNDWPWLTETTPALSWELDTAEIPPNARLLNVSYIGVELLRMEARQFAHYTARGGIPLYYFQEGVQTVKVYPYPDTEQQKTQTLFTYAASINAPAGENDTYPIPQNMIDLLHIGGLTYMAASHTDDVQLHQAYSRDFQGRLRGRVMRQTGKGVSRNMFRNRNNKVSY